jgi:hypothetical protein
LLRPGFNAPDGGGLVVRSRSLRARTGVEVSVGREVALVVGAANEVNV